MSLFHRRAGFVLLLVACLAAVGYLFVRWRRPQLIRPPKVEVARELEGPALSRKALALRDRVKGANLVICVIDAARADHVGCYGYPRATTPILDQLAGESVLFEQHFAQYPHTKPSTASLFTGQYPDTHLIVGKRAMEDRAFSMANALESAGFESVFLSSNPMASPGMGVGVDFECACAQQGTIGVRSPPRGWRSGARTGQRVRRPSSAWYRPLYNPRNLADAFSRWLDEGRTGRFFAYVHFFPPHHPYSAPEEMKQLFAGKKPPKAWQGGFEYPEVAQAYDTEPPNADLPLSKWVNLYDAELRWADWGVGEVEKSLRERGLLDNTLFVVTSDHGEAFGEHGYMQHTDGVYDELLHVPLLLRFPGGEGAGLRVGALTQTVDMLPTLCDLFDIPWSGKGVQGRSLVPLMTGEVDGVHDYVFATGKGETRSYLVRDRDWALILWEGGKLRALYNLRDNPRQTRNIVECRPKQAAQMAEAFRQFAAAQTVPPLEFIDPKAKRGHPRPGPRVTLSEELRRELQALGYVE